MCLNLVMNFDQNVWLHLADEEQKISLILQRILGLNISLQILFCVLPDRPSKGRVSPFQKPGVTDDLIQYVELIKILILEIQTLEGTEPDDRILTLPSGQCENSLIASLVCAYVSSSVSSISLPLVLENSLSYIIQLFQHKSGMLLYTSIMWY